MSSVTFFLRLETKFGEIKCTYRKLVIWTTSFLLFRFSEKSFVSLFRETLAETLVAGGCNAAQVSNGHSKKKQQNDEENSS